MSEQYDNRNRGALFRNNKKKSDNSPDHTGQVETVCQHCGESTSFWLSPWVKVSARGQKFFSLAFTAKEEAANSGSRTSAPSEGNKFDDLDDDIPF